MVQRKKTYFKEGKYIKRFDILKRKIREAIIILLSSDFRLKNV